MTKISGGNRGLKRSFGEVMNYFEPEIGENDVTSNKHMNGYFLEQEALRGVGIPKFLMCPGFSLS